MSAIVVSNLKKYYQVHKKDPGFAGSMKALFHREYFDAKAVDDVSFVIEPGEVVGFIGPNGAGKTTTLKCLSGLLYPTSGKVQVLGYTPSERKPEYLKQISLVMGQKNQLWWDLPARESFALNREIYEIDITSYNKIIGELSELLGVEDILDIQVRKLSLGQRMKCELISALIHTPKILFLDEPTIGLDIMMQENLRTFIKAYNKKHNATVILTSHYMKDVEELCKRVIMIDHGKLLYDGLV
jgi:ABC-2 type transport system ATP-binding protein